MKKLISILFSICLFALTSFAQQVTLNDVARSIYRPESIYGIKPMNDGEHYTRISSDGKKIVKYSFKTGQEAGTIFDVETARNHKLRSFDDYILSPDETKILIQTETKQIYRRSFTAV